MKLFSKEGHPETAINARKRPFMTIIAIVSYYEIKKFFHFALSLHQSRSEYFLLKEWSIGNVPVKYPLFSTSVLFIYFMCEDLT